MKIWKLFMHHVLYPSDHAYHCTVFAVETLNSQAENRVSASIAWDTRRLAHFTQLLNYLSGLVPTSLSSEDDEGCVM